MGKIRILVVEDEPLHMERVEMAIEDLNYSLIAMIDNAEEALRVVRATKPDIILMDINIKGETDGIHLADRVQEIFKTPIIFTTSFADKSTIDRAKVTNPYAYLIKPLELNSLQAAIELAIFKFSSESLGEKEEEEFSWEEDVLFKESFFIKVADRIEKVKHEEVLWMELAKDKYIDIVTSDKRLTMRCSLKQLTEKISQKVFLRVNRTHIVNVKKITSISEGQQTISIGNEEITLGRTYKSQLLTKLNLLN